MAPLSGGFHSTPMWHIAMPGAGAVHTINGGQWLVVEDAVAAPLVRSVLHEVIGPDVVRPFRPEPDAGAVVQPETTTLLLFLRDFEPLAPPDPLDPAVSQVVV